MEERLTNIITESLQDISRRYTVDETAMAYFLYFLSPIYQKLELKSVDEIINQLSVILTPNLAQIVNNTLDLYYPDGIDDKNMLIDFILKIVASEIDKNMMNIKSAFQTRYAETGEIDEFDDSNFIYTPMELFLAIFYKDDLRKLILYLLPDLYLNDYIPFQESTYSMEKSSIYFSMKPYFEIPMNLTEIHNVDDSKKYIICDIMAIFAWILRRNYGLDGFLDLKRTLREQFSLDKSVEPIVYIFVQNIIDNGWDLENPMYYIISIYDNKLIDWSLILNYKQ